MKPLPVVGYTDQKDTTVDVVNENKILEELVLRRIDNIAKSGDFADQRCVALARTKVEEAFMWLNRGIFKPQRITDPEAVEMHLQDVLDNTVPGATVSFKDI